MSLLSPPAETSDDPVAECPSVDHDMVLKRLAEIAALLPAHVGDSADARALLTELADHVTTAVQACKAVQSRLDAFNECLQRLVAIRAQQMSMLSLAAEEADALGHSQVGTGHWILGLLRLEDSAPTEELKQAGVTPEVHRQLLEDSVATQALQQCGVTLEAVREVMRPLP